MVTIGIIASVVILATCGLGAYLLVRDDNMAVGIDPNASPTIPRRDINDRRTDPSKLTVADVFPNKEIVVDPAIPPYKQVGKAQVSECKIAVTAEVNKLLNRMGCNQVVRATFMSTDNKYLLTAGVFNLKDAKSADDAHSQLATLVNASNRLLGFISADSVKIFGFAPTTAATYATGHFLVYTVIARADGKDIAADDTNVKIIVYDILEKYLRDKVIADWAVDEVAEASGSATPT